MQITAIGKELRKLRIDRDEKLIDMAKRLGKSSSFISAIETGSKAPPVGFEDEVIIAYNISGGAAASIRKATDFSKSTFNIQPSNQNGKEMIGLMARRINLLSVDQIRKITEIVMEG